MDLIANNLFKIELEKGDGLEPRCFIDENILQELWLPWKDIEKTFFTMKDKLEWTWGMVFIWFSLILSELRKGCLGKIDITLIWLRFPNLGMEYYDEGALLAPTIIVGRLAKREVFPNLRRDCVTPFILWSS
ncbi:hypothetical protein CR513_61082, partial [Mucuna pruriens]